MSTFKVTGGEKLASKLATIAEKMQGSVAVGFWEGETYPDGTSVAKVAAFNEFGTSKIPARPFMRTTVKTKSAEWIDVLARTAKGTNFDADLTLGIVGQKMTEDISQAITEWQDPPNAASTIKAKGFNKPLVDTNILAKAAKAVVNSK